jgi:hypothetical protein
MDKIEYSRMLVKRTDQTGEVPTVPPITATTLNQFIPTDLFVGEFFLNEVDDLLWVRTSNGILPISLSGSTGTTTTPTLTQVLFQGNVTNGYNIDVSAGDTIIFQGLTTGSTNNVLGIDASGNTIVTSATGGTIIVTGDYLPLSGGTVTGNTYFGSTSGITIDQVNNRLGINTATPQYTIEAFGIKSNVTYQDTSGGVLQISGDTFLPRFNAAGAPSGSKPVFSVSMGVRTYDDVTFPGYGKVADGFVYASNEANGLNIINRQGTGTTEDYIRFYAGQDANGTTPDIHIQGSGSTRGYVGIGTINPTQPLDVAGNTRVGGNLIIRSIGSGSPVINLGLDSSGVVVTGTTGISPVGLYLPLSGGTVTGDTTFTQDFYLTNLTSGGSQTFLTVDSDTGQVYTASSRIQQNITADANQTINASVTNAITWIQSNSSTTRTLNVTNLSGGDTFTAYIQNTNVSNKIYNFQYNGSTFPITNGIGALITSATLPQNHAVTIVYENINGTVVGRI